MERESSPPTCRYEQVYGLKEVPLLQRVGQTNDAEQQALLAPKGVSALIQKLYKPGGHPFPPQAAHPLLLLGLRLWVQTGTAPQICTVF